MPIVAYDAGVSPIGSGTEINAPVSDKRDPAGLADTGGRTLRHH